jgi:iron complex outermembrane receptor protein
VIRKAVIAACCILGASPGWATPRPIRIDAGTLESALAQLSRQAGVSVAVDDPALWARQVHGISATLEPEAALRRLVQDAGAKPVRLGPQTWRVVAVPPPVRRVVRVAPLAEPQPALADVVVTGSKRDLRLDEYAGTVELLDGKRLEADGERGTDGIIARLASVSSTYLGAGRNKLFIRGIADSSFTGPTQSTVGQYLGDIRLTYNAPDPDLRMYDIQSVEVFEGPQGTLYGAGSLGGIVRLIPRAPVIGDNAALLTGGVSATEHGAPGADLGGWANLSLNDHAALRVVGYGLSEGGYIDDIVRHRSNINRTNIGGGRATLLIEPGDGWRVQFGAVLQKIHGLDSQYADRDLPPLERASPTDGGFDANYRMASLIVGKRWADLRFQSSTGLIRHRLDEQYDATIDAANPRLFEQRNHTSMITNETRLWRPSRDGIGWVVGASFTHNQTVLDRALGPVDAILPTTGVTNVVSELTGFAEASVQRSIFTLTAGVRLTHDRLSGSADDIAPASFQKLLLAGTAASRSEDNILPSLALSARLKPGLLAFVRYQEGMRPGGLAVESDLIRRFHGDHIRSVEGGLRFGDAPGDIVGGAVSASYARWTNIQADYVDGGGLPSTSNIGNGRIYSLSGSLRIRPRPNLLIELSSTYNDSRVTEPSIFFIQSLVNAATWLNPLPVAPVTMEPLGRIPNVAKVTSRASARYEIPIGAASDLSFEGWTRYVGSSRLGVGPVLGGKQGSYVETGVSARLASGQFGVTLGVTNLFDAVGNRFALGTPFARDQAQLTPLRPRTIRIGIDHAF